MSRAGYQIPTGSQSGFAVGPTSFGDGPVLSIKYNCGDCSREVSLPKGEPIRCLHCGGRVLYKQRTKRMIQFEAR